MGNNSHRKGQRNTQRQAPHQSRQHLSREQLIHRLETLREELEENTSLNEQRKAHIQADMANYSQQLAKF